MSAGWQNFRVFYFYSNKESESQHIKVNQNLGRIEPFQVLYNTAYNYESVL